MNSVNERLSVMPDRNNSEPSSANPGTARHRVHVRELWLLLAALLLAVVLYAATFKSIVDIWLRSETFVHGFLIYPISGYLVWRRWPVLRTIDVTPYFPGLLGLLALTLAWWLADFLGIQVGKQLAVVAMLPMVILSLAGLRFTRAIAFPLAYTLFAVPFGEGAIPALIDFTATFTVEALQLTGFPVLREGVFFSIPAGNFEVAKACSGIRYLLASVALGTLYGYLIYHNPWKRVAFFVFALLLPIVANGLRAYGIVLLAHYSGMTIAVGVDHIIFGWLFFGLVMFLMFWIGDRFRDRPLAEAITSSTGTGPEGSPSPFRRFLPILAAGFTVMAVGPVASSVLGNLTADLGPAGLPAEMGEWQDGRASGQWYPEYRGATWELLGEFARDDQVIEAAVVRYDTQSQAAELANARNAIADLTSWEIARWASVELNLPDNKVLTVSERVLVSTNGTRLVWYWHEVNGVPVYGDYQTKWRELQSIASLKLPVSAALMVSTPITDQDRDPRATLETFLQRSIKGLRECLYASSPAPGSCNAAGENIIDINSLRKTETRGL